MLAHLGNGAHDGRRILRPETAREMHTRHRTLHPLLPGMAHGFIEGLRHGYRGYGHGGGTVHFLSSLEMIPDLDLGVFISTNTVKSHLNNINQKLQVRNRRQAVEKARDLGILQLSKREGGTG